MFPRPSGASAGSKWGIRVEMLWRHFRREVTHCELFESLDAVLEATREFFDRCNRAPRRTRAIIGAHPTGVPTLYLGSVRCLMPEECSAVRGSLRGHS